VVPIPCLDDNYAYLIIDEDTKTAGAVDPVTPENITKEATKQGVKVTCILTTHHHSDHAGGNKEMVKHINNGEVYGGDDRIDALTKKVGEGDKFNIGSIKVSVFFTPCHTRGHVLYYCEQEGRAPCIFTGDTLFIGGCGRFFEGDASQMYHALVEVISKLSSKTQVYCGHEYTVANLKFAKSVDPNNKNLLDKLKWAEEKRAKGEYTVPSTVAEELSFNPFLRVDKSEVAKAVGVTTNNPVDVMRELRESKNKFKG